MLGARGLPFAQAEKKAKLASVMDTTEGPERPQLQKEEDTVIPSPPPPQQQPTDPASPTVATTPEPISTGGGDKVAPQSADMELEYEVKRCSLVMFHPVKDVPSDPF